MHKKKALKIKALVIIYKIIRPEGVEPTAHGLVMYENDQYKIFYFSG